MAIYHTMPIIAQNYRAVWCSPKATVNTLLAAMLTWSRRLAKQIHARTPASLACVATCLQHFLLHHHLTDTALFEDKQREKFMACKCGAVAANQRRCMACSPSQPIAFGRNLSCILQKRIYYLPHAPTANESTDSHSKCKGKYTSHMQGWQSRFTT